MRSCFTSVLFLSLPFDVMRLFCSVLFCSCLFLVKREKGERLQRPLSIKHQPINNFTYKQLVWVPGQIKVGPRESKRMGRLTRRTGRRSNESVDPSAKI
jgi:hypothetical protein